jgi:hypothetical protein
MERSKPNMTPRRIMTTALVLALGIPAVFSLLPGCENTPSEPVFENPFDPLGPHDGDPLQAQAAAINDTTISIAWNQPQNLGIMKYFISRSAHRDSGYSQIGEKEHTAAPSNSFPYYNPDPTSTHWFRVQALTDTDFSLTSYATPDSATSGPRVIVGSGSGHTATRFTNLEITVTEGDMVRIALDPTFTDSLRIVPAGASGVPINLTYDLGAAADNNETKTLYVVAFADGFESVPSVQDIRVDFKPAFTVVGDPISLATRTVDLVIPTEGVLNMRFFPEWADTATTPWVPVSDTYTGYQLSDSANSQFIRAQFQGDFGFNSLVEHKVTPDLLTSITFRLDLAEDHVTDQSIVAGLSSAVATHMRYSESADFTSAPWITYADTVQIDLGSEPGHKVIYVQYLNDWTQSGTLTDYVIHVTQPAEISFWAPLEGDVIKGGAVFQVRGASTVGSEAGSVFLVKFDPGDGNGFVDVTGTESWSHLWDVPRFTADTPLTLRAQAWYGPSPDTLQTITTAITVTVTQLAVTITDPVDGANLTGNKSVNFTGTAAGVLNGAPMDSVTIDIGDDHFPASGTSLWTAEWTAPLWDADSTLTLTTTVWADGDTAMTSIEVNVIRPPVAITEPALDDLLDGDTDVTIAGVTFGDLFAAPVDSVVVDISSDAGSAHLPATGTDSWSTVWHTPVVTANARAKIIAVAFAGAESRADTISVTVKP